MKECSNCLGQGLVSTGSVPHDLSVGSKVTCAVCGGKGSVNEDGSVIAAAPEAVVAPEAPASDVQPDPVPPVGDVPADVPPQEDPKVEAPASEPSENAGPVSSEPSTDGSSEEQILPKAGDPCKTVDDQDGTLQLDGEKLVCVPVAQ